MGRRPKDPNGYSLAQTASQKVAERVRALIKDSGKAQGVIARGAGLDPTHLSALLAADGSRNFQRWQIVALAKALNTTERAIADGIVPEAALLAPVSVTASPANAPPRPSVPGAKFSLDEFIAESEAELERRRARLRSLREVLQPRINKDERLTVEEWQETFAKLERIFTPQPQGS